MKNTWNKEYEYRNYTFNIKVELCTDLNTPGNPDQYHTVLINDMGVTNYYDKFKVIKSQTECILEQEIQKGINRAKNFVEERENLSQGEKLLINMGFK